MPIRPEMRARYPKNWKLISRFIRHYRAKNKCEWCGALNGEPHPITGSKVVLTTAHVFDQAAIDAAVAEERERLNMLRAFVADDSIACTYQSLGQYRTALLRALRALPASCSRTLSACSVCGVACKAPLCLFLAPSSFAPPPLCILG